MALVKCGPLLHVNTECVTSFAWESRNQGRENLFVIYMTNGVEHRLNHETTYEPKIDCYKIEAALIAAMTEKEPDA